MNVTPATMAANSMMRIVSEASSALCASSRNTRTIVASAVITSTSSSVEIFPACNRRTSARGVAVTCRLHAPCAAGACLVDMPAVASPDPSAGRLSSPSTSGS